MPSASRASGPAASWWAPAGWFALVVLGAASAWAVCLPVESADAWSTPAAGSVFRLEWFLAIAVLAVPIWHVARSSWLLGLACVAITSTQVLCIADEGAHRLQQTGMLAAVTDLLYIAAMLQIAVFVAVGVSGTLRNLADRRWAKLVAQLAALDATSSQRQR
jgi:hypothetical protein